MTKEFDSIIFDMDGTLWDAVDTYAEIWNETYRLMGIDARVNRAMLIDCMGLTLDRIVAILAPEDMDKELFRRTLRQVDARLMPRLGGRLYDGVDRYIRELAETYRLFMVSNCGPHGLDYFLDFTGLRPWFTDTLTNGQTGLPKKDNIELLRKRHSLRSPIYIGDTQGDCDNAHAAGIPMVFCSYGFGQCDNAEFTASDFRAVASIFLPSNKKARSE